MKKYVHKVGGGNGGITVLCPWFRKKWEVQRQAEQRKKRKMIRNRVNSSKKRSNNHCCNVGTRR